MSAKKALGWLAFWISLSLIFNAVIFFLMGKEKALEYFGGYIIEQSLSVDNLFLFIIVFSSFGIKLEYQKRVLNYGIMGAIVLRLIFIVLGVAVINMFDWVLNIFGVILIISGVKMIWGKKVSVDYKKSKIIKLLCKIIPVTDKLEGEKFFIRKKGMLYATPLFAIVIVIEFTDILFAIDSIPAVFSISTDPFIVYTSNIFAILGLRNLYFVLGKLHERFQYVKYGVALILIFTGFKLVMMIFELHIPIEWSLAVIFIILAVSVAASILVTRWKSIGLQD